MELKNNHQNLQQENKYLHKQLELLNQKLKESDAFKSHFLSNVTNEIINPFASIIGISKNITKLNSNNIGQIHSMAHLIYNEAFDLDFQLQNIFAAAKIESGELNLEISSVQPVELIKNLIEELRFKAEKKSQYIEFTSSPLVPHNFVTDEEKIHIIFKNLLSNAIIFGSEKSKITVDLHFSENHIILTVNNKGPLIIQEDLKNIFNRFTKLDKTINSINQGHGLGLSVTKAYLDFMEGDIKAESEKELGNTFSIYLKPIESDSETLIRDDDLFIDDSELF